VLAGVLRTPVETLARMIATARANAHRRVDQLLAAQLSSKRRRELDALLDGASGQPSSLADLRGRAARTGVKEALGQVERYRRLIALGALEIDVTSLPPVRRRALEAMGRRMTAQQRRRLEQTRPSVDTDRWPGPKRIQPTPSLAAGGCVTDDNTRPTP